MKTLTSIIMLLSLALAVSCGGDKGKKSNNLGFYDMQANPYQVPASSVQNGLLNPQSGVLEVGGATYQVNQIYGIQGSYTQPQTQPVNGQYNQMYMQQPIPQLGQQYVYQAFNQLQAYRPAYYANGIVKYNVRVTGYAARYAGMSAAVLVLTAPLQPF